MQWRKQLMAPFHPGQACSDKQWMAAFPNSKQNKYLDADSTNDGYAERLKKALENKPKHTIIDRRSGNVGSNS